VETIAGAFSVTVLEREEESSSDTGFVMDFEWLSLVDNSSDAENPEPSISWID
jgi:hypothetical protein